MADDGNITKDSAGLTKFDAPVKRRTFLKKSAIAGAGVATLYVAPQFSSVFARPAYAGVTGPGVTVTKSFGKLTEATFGGSGIPNNYVAITNITGLVGGATITLGLTATQRYTAPAVTNNGAGVFTGTAGVDAGGTTGLWNFDYHMEIVGGTFADYKFRVLYDFDPGVNTAEASLGKIDVNSWIVLALGGTLASTTLFGDSQNLTFGWLAPLAANPVVTPPSYSPFSATAHGEYSFELLAKTNAGVEIGRTSMKVKAA